MNKRISLILILYALFFSFGILLYSSVKEIPEIIILPKNYSGEILIIYDQEDGRPSEYEGLSRIYRIPEDGVLSTQFIWNPGFSNRRFGFMENGTFTEVLEIESGKSVSENDPDSNVYCVQYCNSYFYEKLKGRGYELKVRRFLAGPKHRHSNLITENKMDSLLKGRFNWKNRVGNIY